MRLRTWSVVEPIPVAGGGGLTCAGDGSRSTDRLKRAPTTSSGAPRGSSDRGAAGPFALATDAWGAPPTRSRWIRSSSAAHARGYLRLTASIAPVSGSTT